MKSPIAAITAALLLSTAGFAGVAHAQAAQASADAMTDPAMKRAEVIAFIGVKPGDRVADVVDRKSVV